MMNRKRRSLTGMLFIVMSIVFVSFQAKAGDIYVYDDGQQVTVAWPTNAEGNYWKVYSEDLTVETGVAVIHGVTFGREMVITGLKYHNIYKIYVEAYDETLTLLDVIGSKYITFALDSNDPDSGVCICNCPEIPDPPKTVLYGVVADGWATGIAIGNGTSEKQLVTLYINETIHHVSVPSNSCKTMLLTALVDEPKPYVITYDASDGVGVVAVLMNGVGVCAQN